MEFLVRKMILELRDNKVYAEDLIDMLEWFDSPEFTEHVDEIQTMLGCCEKAARETAIAAKILATMRPQINSQTYNRVAKLADDCASWLLEVRHLPNAKFLVAFQFDKTTGDMDSRPGKYVEFHYEWDDDDDNDYDYQDPGFSDDADDADESKS
jgi:hypothetical protein